MVERQAIQNGDLLSTTVDVKGLNVGPSLKIQVGRAWSGTISVYL